MPIYEFECPKCECRFEKLVFPNDDEKPQCPTCCTEEVRRVVSAASVKSGGSGDFLSSRCAPSGG